MKRTVYYDWQGNEIEPPKADPVPVTNADRIRQMSDEELATVLYAGCSGRECPEGMWGMNRTEDEEDSLCLKCTIAWLKSPWEVQE